MSTGLKLIFAINEVQRVIPGTNNEVETIPAGEVFEGSTNFFKTLDAHGAVREPNEGEIAIYERKKAAGERAADQSTIAVGGGAPEANKPLTAAEKKKAEAAAKEAEAARLKREQEDAAAAEAEKKRKDEEENVL